MPFHQISSSFISESGIVRVTVRRPSLAPVSRPDVPSADVGAYAARNTATPLIAYYISHNEIFQARDLHSLVSSRLVSLCLFFFFLSLLASFDSTSLGLIFPL